MGNKAVFIDRDGTININFGYIDNPDDFKIYPGVKEGIRRLKEKGFKIIVITNQSGIGRGYFSEEVVEKIHEKMKKELSENVDGIYFCPHRPDEKCNCRKPNIQLLEKAASDLDIDIDDSFMIGDRMLDVEAGEKLGCKTVLVPENKEKIKVEMEESKVKPDFICADFYSGVKWILGDK